MKVIKLMPTAVPICRATVIHRIPPIEMIVNCRLDYDQRATWGWGKCPLCESQYNSQCFNVWIEKQTFSCDSCRQSGDPIDFIRKYYELDSDIKSIEYAINKYGLYPDSLGLLPMHYMEE